MRKSLFALICLITLLIASAALADAPYWVELTMEEQTALAEAGETILSPSYTVPEHVRLLINVARQEIGYTEQRGNVTKYGECAGNPAAEWCAEYLCWCVDQVDQRYGTSLLNRVYPNYGARNIGMRWFLREGRYISRRGTVPGYGSQWLIGSEENIGKNGYIPQPGDWMFFALGASGDTTHVCMVEYATRRSDGQVLVHVLEGNKPDKVQQTVYKLDEENVLGYGTVFDLADVVLKAGCEGVKVTNLQELLVEASYLSETYVTGTYGTHTTDAVRAFQAQNGIEQTGVAGHETQLKLQRYIIQYRRDNPALWAVVDEDE